MAPSVPGRRHENRIWCVIVEHIHRVYHSIHYAHILCIFIHINLLDTFGSVGLTIHVRVSVVSMIVKVIGG